jgi:hypothetical protein
VQELSAFPHLIAFGDKNKRKETLKKKWKRKKSRMKQEGGQDVK